MFNGVEVETFSKATPWPTEGPTIFFIGRHEPRKGLAVLLEAMGELPAHVRLWIAGDGPETEQLRQRVAGDARIEWLGRISDEEKAARMRGADVFCAPSLRGESFGVVLLEAMAAETPVVASDLPGYANVAQAGRDALLVPPGSPAISWPTPSGGCWPIRPRRPGTWPRASSGPRSCRWNAWPSATWRCTAR